MGYPDTFTGFCVDSPQTWNQFQRAELTPKPFGDHDIDVEVEACGVCGSDVHTVTGGWGPYQGPLCVGHEIVGRAVRVGSHVRGISRGDRVGVGGQVWACLECDLCRDGQENYCAELIDTYNDRYRDGSRSHGGFASHVRAHEYFTFRMPEGLEPAVAAPLLCAGITTYAPLSCAGIGPGRTVGVMGIGGLGHLALQFSRALGAETYALTTSRSKVDDCLALGAGGVIVTSEEDGWEDEWRSRFDMILCCSDMAHKLDMGKCMKLMRPGGDFHMLGVPDEDLARMSAGDFIWTRARLTGSHLGNHQEMEAMLRLAAEKGVKPWVEVLKMGEDGCREAVERVRANKVRYRLAMTGYDEAFGRG